MAEPSHGSAAGAGLAAALVAVSALHRDGRLAEARAACAELVARFPGEAEPRFRAGLLAAEAGDLAAAKQELEEAIRRGERPHFHYARGDVLERLGEREAAIEAWRRAVALQPALAPAHARLGVALQESGETAQATAHFVMAAQLRPEDPRAWSNLAVALLAQDRAREAEVAARNALKLDEGQASATANLGRALVAQGREAEAIPVLERATALDARNARAWDLLGICRSKAGALLAAREAFRQAVAIDGAFAQAWLRLGATCTHLGSGDEAVAAYRQAEAHGGPEAAQVGSALLFALQYDGSHGTGEVFEAHRAWADRYAPARPAPEFRNTPEPERRLRIGYLSPRFHLSSAAFLHVPAIERHDAAAFEVRCYADQEIEDHVTGRLRASGAKWIDVRGLDDAQLAARMREDGIDILVDLAGHTPGHRLTALAHGPAPVIGTWLDYFNTTGMTQVDFLVTDAVHSPPGDAQPFTERLLRMPHCRYCWEPPSYAPPVVPPPLARGGEFPVFGAFNRMAKVSPAALDAWCALLRAVPGSRLVVKNSSVGRAEENAYFAPWFSERGVDPSRVEWRTATGHEVMLAAFADVDIALDTFPYNGGLTTLEALWMGRPVVGVEGATLISRQTNAILAAIGLPELCASDARAFVEVAAGLAADATRLAALCAGLRVRMQASPLLDHAGFTRDFESLLRGEWRRWCASRGSSSG